jgi:hypothetical protein
MVSRCSVKPGDLVTMRVVLVLGFVLSIAGCAADRTQTSRGPTTVWATGPESSISPSSPLGGPTGFEYRLPSQFEHPLPPEYEVTLDQAIMEASFDVVVPSSELGTPVIYLDNAESSGITPVYFAYTHPTYGIFLITEYPTDLTQEQLEEQVSLNGSPGVVVTFSTVAVQDKFRAVLTEGGGGNGVEWLDNGIYLAVTGPFDTFTADYALAVANTVGS